MRRGSQDGETLSSARVITRNGPTSRIAVEVVFGGMQWTWVPPGSRGNPLR